MRAVCGTADPGDEYCIKFLGQKIITSKHDVFELEKRADSAGTFVIFLFCILFLFCSVMFVCLFAVLIKPGTLQP